MEHFQTGVDTEAVIESAQQMFDLMCGSGFIEDVTGKRREYMDRALSQLQSVITRWPQTQWAVEAQICIVTIFIQELRRDRRYIGEALTEGQKLAAMSGGDATAQAIAMSAEAFAYLQLGQHDRAIGLFRQAEKKHPDRALKSYLAGMAAYAFLGKHDLAGAQAEYQRVVREYPTQYETCAGARYAIATILEQMCDYQAAIGAYQEVMAKHPASDEALLCAEQIRELKQAMATGRPPMPGDGCLLPVFIGLLALAAASCLISILI